MRPKQSNTLTTTMIADLTKSLSTLARDKSVFRIIITGSGKFFCTGMDLSSKGATTSSDAAEKDSQFSTLTGLFGSISAAPQVTIACINGPCFGGGVPLLHAWRLSRFHSTLRATPSTLGRSRLLGSQALPHTTRFALFISRILGAPWYRNSASRTRLPEP